MRSSVLVQWDVCQGEKVLRHDCDCATRIQSGTSGAAGVLLLPLLLIIQQIGCCLPLLAHALEGRLLDYVVVIRDPAGVPVLVACAAVNAVANVMACRGQTNKGVPSNQALTANGSPLLTPFPKWLTTLFSENLVYGGKQELLD